MAVALVSMAVAATDTYSLENPSMATDPHIGVVALRHETYPGDRPMNSKPVLCALKIFLASCAFLLGETASFAANNNSVTYDITQGAGGSAVVNWTVLGGLNSSGVGFYPVKNNGNGFNGFIIDASGIFNGAYFTNIGLATLTDGSKFSANDGVSLSSTSSVTSFVAIHSGTGDRFGLTMSSAFPGSSDLTYSYTLNFLSGTGSFVLPISYSAFNVGTYFQTQPSVLDGGPYAGTFNTTVNVVALPEPSTCMMALAGLACGGYVMLQRRKRA